jgi:hypothetical protein
MNIDPELALKEECAEEYAATMSGFFAELAELNANIVILERLMRFPSDLFGVGPNTGGVFLPLTIVNMARASVLMVTRLTTDTVETARTLPKFKNRIERDLIRDEYRRAFRLRMRERRFDSETRALLDKAKQLRDTHIAHFTTDRSAVPITLAEIKALRDGLNALFQSLSFNAQYEMLTVEYQERPTDLDKILDSIAKDSAVVHSPERKPDLWPVRRSKLATEELDLINRYREELCLPRA